MVGGCSTCGVSASCFAGEPQSLPLNSSENFDGGGFTEKLGACSSIRPPLVCKSSELFFSVKRGSCRVLDWISALGFVMTGFAHVADGVSVASHLLQQMGLALKAWG